MWSEWVAWLILCHAIVFCSIPALYISRRLARARSKPPLLLGAIFGQLLAAMCIFAWLGFLFVPHYLRLFRTWGCTLPTLTMSWLDFFIFLKTPAGLLTGVLLITASLRTTGRLLRSRWESPSYPAWKIDLAGLAMWVPLAAALSLAVLGLARPLLRHRLQRPEGSTITRIESLVQVMAFPERLP